MAQDCFLTFGIRRQMIMMQPGKLSILPLESKQWGIKRFTKASWTQYPVSFEKECYTVLLSHQNPITDGTSDLSKEWEIHEYTTTQFWTACNMYACTLFWFAVGR